MRTTKTLSIGVGFLAVLMLMTHGVRGEENKVSPVAPCRLSSIGDSITEAVNAELPFANHWASWVNGYHGFWQWLFGLTDVNSHNQRISRKFRWQCWGRRKNYMEAESGADSYAIPAQAEGSVDHRADYVTIFMGHNDVCQDSEDEITPLDHFEDNVRAGLESLASGLPNGASIYIVGMADVTKLWEVAKDKKALGIVDCEALWFFTLFELFPCWTVLGPGRTDEDRERMRYIIEDYNAILSKLAVEFNENDPSHHYYYTDEVFLTEFMEYHVSDIDCFHPSAQGQKDLAEITWQAGPFGD